MADINIHIGENKFLLTSLTRACRLHNDKILHKFLVHKGLVQIILRTVETYWNETTPQLYLVTLYQAMFITTYYGSFHVAEITMNENSHTIKVKDVHIGLNKNKLLLLLHSSKTHCPGNVPQTMKISAIGNGASKVRFCPFELFWKYLRIRPERKTDSEPFFIFHSGDPVSSNNFREMLKKLLSKATLYSSHSFRAGRAGDLLKAGILVEMIKKLGRWHSNTIYNYSKL